MRIQETPLRSTRSTHPRLDESPQRRSSEAITIQQSQLRHPGRYITFILRHALERPSHDVEKPVIDASTVVKGETTPIPMVEHVDEVIGYVHVLERKVVGKADATESLDFTVCDYCGREMGCDEDRKNSLENTAVVQFLERKSL